MTDEDKTIIQAELERHEKAALKAFENYQDSGNGRYYTSQVRHEVLADALRTTLTEGQVLDEANAAIRWLRMLGGKLGNEFETDDDRLTRLKEIEACIRMATGGG